MMKSINYTSIALAAFLLSTPSTSFTISNGLPSHAKSKSSTSSTSLSMSAALIVQNKGGGHGELGFQLAKTLQSNEKITSITILQDDACNDEQEPFKSYSTDIPDVTIVKAPLSSDPDLTAEIIQSTLGQGKSYEYVWDNASKKPEGAGKAICDLAKSWNTKLFTYVSSAGIYKPTPTTTFPMSESTPINESSGQHQFDTYALSLNLPLVSFRPQYIYGPKSNKYDYLDWYFDRLVRNLPLPIPSPGTQKVSLTDSRDVASLLASVLNDESAAIETRYFNCGTDVLSSYDEVAEKCARAAGVEEYDVEHYDHEMFGKAKFPFRMTDFYVSPDLAKEKLGWGGPKHSLDEDLEEYFEGYKGRGGPEKKMSWGKDWEIVVGSKSFEEIGSVYDEYDPIVIIQDDVKDLGRDVVN